MDWYLLQTKPNAHITACEHLKRQGFDVFLPLINKTIKKNGKFLNAKVALFPGYLFMGTPINFVPWSTINGTRGVSRAVTLDGVYRPINTEIIEILKQRCDKNYLLNIMDNITVGDRVKIESGPFADFICNVQDIADDGRIWVFIDILKQQTKAKISSDTLYKIN